MDELFQSASVVGENSEDTTEWLTIDHDFRRITIPRSNCWALPAMKMSTYFTFAARGTAIPLISATLIFESTI